MVAWTPLHNFWTRFPQFLRTALATAPVLAITAYLYLESRNSERLLLEAETARQADSSLLQFQGFVAARIDALKDAGNFVVSSSGASNDDFSRYARRLLAGVPYFDSLSQVGPPGAGASGSPRREPIAPGSDDSMPTLAPFGLALAKALASHQPAATGSFDLPNGEKAVTIIVPILRDDQPDGALTGTIRLNAGIREMYGADVPSLWNMELADRSGRVVLPGGGGRRVPDRPGGHPAHPGGGPRLEAPHLAYPGAGIHPADRRSTTHSSHRLAGDARGRGSEFSPGATRRTPG